LAHLLKTVLTAPLGAGRTSLVEESAGQPLAVAANDQLVMQCRHPMLADVDVATRVNVHMPWLSSDRGPSGHDAPVGACIVMLQRKAVNPLQHGFIHVCKHDVHDAEDVRTSWQLIDLSDRHCCHTTSPSTA
jgi:hypothetical protein